MEKPTNTTEATDAMTVPSFDDEGAIAHAVTETGLPEPRVRAVVEATYWDHVCAGVMGIEGGDSEARIAAKYAGLWNCRGATRYDRYHERELHELVGAAG